MIVYKTTNLINGKIYVGQKPSMNNSEDFFASNYYGSGRLITEAVREFGEVNFKREILDFADTREELNEKETKWISKYNATSADIGYNLSEKTWPPPPGCGKDNSMYGRCAYDIWVEKYEAEEADRRKLLQLKKRGAYKGKDNPNYGNGDKVRGEKNPMFGKGYLKI